MQNKTNKNLGKTSNQKSRLLFSVGKYNKNTTIGQNGSAAATSPATTCGGVGEHALLHAASSVNKTQNKRIEEI